MASPHSPNLSKVGYALLAGAAGLSVYWLMNNSGEPRPADSAPGRTARKSKFGDYIVSGRSVTVNASRDSLYDQWRDLQSFGKLLDNISEVTEVSPNRWSWQLHGPADRQAKVEVDLFEDRRGEVLAWKSTEASEVTAHGKIAFTDAPGGRGTRVEATISYQPPLGQPGHWVAKLTGRDPATLARHGLKRMKMLAETGELATASNQAGPQDSGGTESGSSQSGSNGSILSSYTEHGTSESGSSDQPSHQTGSSESDSNQKEA